MIMGRFDAFSCDLRVNYAYFLLDRMEEVGYNRDIKNKGV